jgi:hypothetical protein
LPGAVAEATAGLHQAITDATAGLPTAITDATAGLPAALEAATAETRQAVAEHLVTSVTSFAATADGLRADLLGRLDQAVSAPSNLAARVEEFVGLQFAELARREDGVAGALADLRAALDAAASAPSTDPALSATVDRVCQVVEGQQGDVTAMRDAVRGLLDSVERHGAVSSQVAELLLENRASLAREIDRMHGPLEAAADAPARLQSMQAQLDARLAAVEQAVRQDLQALAATGQDPAQLDEVAGRISQSVQRESAVLAEAVMTRLEVLAEQVDAMRGALDSSIGRKATEVGRKLAADLGIRGGRKADRADRADKIDKPAR